MAHLDSTGGNTAVDTVRKLLTHNDINLRTDRAYQGHQRMLTISPGDSRTCSPGIIEMHKIEIII